MCLKRNGFRGRDCPHCASRKRKRTRRTYAVPKLLRISCGLFVFELFASSQQASANDWEQRKLGEFSTKRTTKNTDGAIKESFTNSAEHGVVSQMDYFDHGITNDANVANYTVVEQNDFVYNPRISVTAPVGPINRCRLLRPGVMSPLYTVFRTDGTIDELYLEHYFKTKSWHSFMYLEGNSGVRSDRFSISDRTFFEMPISCPSLEEQNRVACFMESLDSLIALHQRERSGC